MLILQMEEKKDHLYATLEGSLTCKETYQLEHYLIPYMIKRKTKSLVCDCKKLKKIDFDGKYALLKTKVVLKKQKGEFLLCDVKESIKKELIGYRMRIQ